MGDTASRNLSDGTLIISDGSTPPRTLTIPLDMGDVGWTINPRPASAVHNRAEIKQVRRGKEVLNDLEFRAAYTSMIGDDSPTVFEVLTRTGKAAQIGWTSVGEANGDDYCVDVKLVIAAPPDGSKSETLTFGRFFHGPIASKEGEAYNTFDVRGQFVKFSGTRS
jgi:hypothetical protein